MREASWEECKEQHSASKRTIDKAKANSLIEIAKSRLNFLENNEIKNDTVNFIFEGYYSSITELLHAILINDGFNVSNHICLGFYIRDVLKNRSLFERYDDCRYKRNSLLYYGKQMHFEIAKESIEKAKSIIIELNDLINK